MDVGVRSGLQEVLPPLMLRELSNSRKHILARQSGRCRVGAQGLRERGRERERETDGQTDRQPARERERQTDRERERERERAGERARVSE